MRPLTIAHLTLMDNYILISISAMALATLVFVVIEMNESAFFYSFHIYGTENPFFIGVFRKKTEKFIRAVI